MRMGSDEITVLFWCGTAMFAVSLLLLLFTGKNALYISLGITLVISIVLSFLGGILLSWGGQYAASKFLLCFFFTFIVPFGLALISKYTFIDSIKTKTYFTTTNIVIFIAILAIFGRFVLQYGQYPWVIYKINRSVYDSYLLEAYIWGLKNGYEQRVTFAKIAPELLNTDSLDLTENEITYHEGSVYKGSPRSLTVEYYSRKEQKFYKGLFKLPTHEITRLQGAPFLYPFFGNQKYYALNLVIKEFGRVELQLNSPYETKTVFSGVCETIEKEDFLRHKGDREYNKTIEGFEAEGPIEYEFDYSEAQWSVLEKPIQISHKITGLTEKVLAFEAMTIAGERYDLEKKYWIGEVLPTDYSAIAYFKVLTKNLEGKELVWTFQFDTNYLLEVLTNKKAKHIEYNFNLSVDEDGEQLKVKTSEVINGEKMEFDSKVSAQYISES